MGNRVQCYTINRRKRKSITKSASMPIASWYRPSSISPHHGHTRPPARPLELDRPRHRHHDRRRHLPHARRHRDARARSGVDAGRLGARRADRAVRRAGVRGALGVDARDRRHVCLPARRLGPAVRLPLRMGAAGADPRRRARRHLVGVRRVLPAGLRHRSGRASATGPTISPPARSSSPAPPTSSASSSARCSPASRRSPSSAR